MNYLDVITLISDNTICWRHERHESFFSLIFRFTPTPSIWRPDTRGPDWHVASSRPFQQLATTTFINSILKSNSKVWASCQYEDRLSTYGDSHKKDKTVEWPSCLHDGNPYTGKTMYFILRWSRVSREDTYIWNQIWLNWTGTCWTWSSHTHS